MSVSTEVQRTLVKSPPELWSELSNPEALARHLSRLGEIRITAVEPETKVEWEAESATGIVHLKQSGWGTKVTLSVTHATPAGDTPPEPEVIAAEPEPVAVEVQTQPEAPSQPVIEPEPASEPESESELEAIVFAPAPNTTVESEPDATEPEPHLGFFARLFRRRKTRQPEVVHADPDPSATTEPEPETATEPEIEVVALAAPEPIYPERPVEPETTEPAEDLAAELESVEAQMAQETTELLTGVLDRLGAAHHRPFSRG